MKILKPLIESVGRKRPEVWPSNWIIHDDNTLAQKARSLKHFLAQNSITEMENPHCFTDLAANDFWLFPKIKSALKKRGFQDNEDVHKCDDSTEFLHNRSSKNVSNSGSIVGLIA
jgi:hypothetical protein